MSLKTQESILMDYIRADGSEKKILDKLEKFERLLIKFNEKLNNINNNLNKKDTTFHNINNNLNKKDSAFLEVTDNGTNPTYCKDNIENNMKNQNNSIN